MLDRCPSPRHPPLSAPRGQLRAAYRLAAGLSPAAVARAEAVAEREIAALLAQPDFQVVVTALRDLQGLPEEERLRRLERHAWQVLELALVDGDWRAAAFIAHEIRLGNNPARTLARGATQAHAHAAAPPPTPMAEPDPEAPPAPAAAPRPYDPVGAARRRAAAAMRAGVTAEAVLAHEPAPAAVAEPAAPARPRRPDRLAARLRAGTAGRATAPADTVPRGLLRAWAQGP
jgi:hypothetical protein